MTQSGHMVAQKAHPIHRDSSVISTGLCPFLLIFPFANAKIFFGQASTQSPQPLQRSVLKVSFAIGFSPFQFKGSLLAGGKTISLSFKIFCLKLQGKQVMQTVCKRRHKRPAHRRHFDGKSAHCGKPLYLRCCLPYCLRRRLLSEI